MNKGKLFDVACQGETANPDNNKRQVLRLSTDAAMIIQSTRDNSIPALAIEFLSHSSCDTGQRVKGNSNQSTPEPHANSPKYLSTSAILYRTNIGTRSTVKIPKVRRAIVVSRLSTKTFTVSIIQMARIIKQSYWTTQRYPKSNVKAEP